MRSKLYIHPNWKWDLGIDFGCWMAGFSFHKEFGFHLYFGPVRFGVLPRKYWQPKGGGS